MSLQDESLKKCIDKHGFFVCPSCGEGWYPSPKIENEGDEETQVFCNYGCDFIILEDYNFPTDKNGLL